ncbi:MAG: hypothetical protein JWP41_3757 [Ramlibacter sp.]|nr:hypothetical protein [Ramlibacter sp.]
MRIQRNQGKHFGDSPEGMVLKGVRHVATGEIRFPPPEFLLGDETVEEVSLGTLGRLYTFTTVHPGKAPSYSLAMVDFDPGLRVFGRLLTRDGVMPALDSPVRVVPFTLPDGTADYAFEAVGGDTK